jgi:hypothetical protein
MTSLTVLLLTLGLAAIVATLLATAAGVLSWLDGAAVPGALLRAGIAFGGSLTLFLVLIATITAAQR